MGYSLKEFSALKLKFNEVLFSAAAEPLSCQLYEYIRHENEHVPEACNIADIIQAIRRILSLPRSNKACLELSEILIVQLDILREYIRDSFGNYNYIETNPDKIIRRWAGFIKHPKRYVFAHRCFEHVHFDYIVDSDFLAQWDNLDGKAKDKEKRKLANKVVHTKLPGIEIFHEFFESCSQHLIALIDKKKKNHSNH